MHGHTNVKFTDLFRDQTHGYRQLLLVGQSGQDMKLTINLNMPRLRMCGTVWYLLSLFDFVSGCSINTGKMDVGNSKR